MSGMSIKNQRPSFARTSAVKLTAAALLVGATMLSAVSPVSAQGGFGSTSQAGRNGLGDGSSFYMSRRQIQFVDDSPIIKNSNGQVQPGGAAGFASQQGGQAPLQRPVLPLIQALYHPEQARPCPKLTMACPCKHRPQPRQNR